MPIGHLTVGAGPAKVLVLHGWLTDHTVYEPAMPWLDRTFFSWTFMDARGYGASRAIPGDHTIVEITRDALALADHLGWDRFLVVGDGMGGKAAQALAANAPDRVTGLALIAPLPLEKPALGELMTTLTEVWASEAGRGQIMTMNTGDRLGPVWQDAMTERSLNAVANDTLKDYFHAWANTDLSVPAGSLDTPCAILLGAHDPAFTEDEMTAIVAPAFKSARLTVLNEAGHYPMLETPPLFAHTLHGMLHDLIARR